LSPQTKITIIDAVKIISAQHEGFDIISAVDYQDWFVFSILPSNLENDDEYIMSLIGVTKQTGDMIGFNPLQHDPQKYFDAVSTRKLNLKQLNIRRKG